MLPDSPLHGFAPTIRGIARTTAGGLGLSEWLQHL
ncbi:hypothetical protein LNP74_15015 [Klebsiella pneumoniae subsp. pneumoniae]|nr:hypothetical protein [Klebsiella pneumoniae subsp. pneumoniae]